MKWKMPPTPKALIQIPILIGIASYSAWLSLRIGTTVKIELGNPGNTVAVQQLA